jgi:DNA polymerase-3 subunit delta'
LGESCRACTGAAHPDWTEVELGSARSIGRAEVADFPTRALVPPLMAPVRVFAVRNADRMTPEAANLLLKLVEEPPDPVVVVLITDRVHDVLPTLRSRCRWVAVRDAAPAPLAPKLPDWTDPGWSETLGSVSEGLRERVRACKEDPATVRRLIDQWDAVVSAALDLEQNANREIVRRRLEFRVGRE